MTKKNKKIVIIGGGHNALTCSAYLAKTGFAVELYEARSQIGGMASTREFAMVIKYLERPISCICWIRT